MREVALFVEDHAHQQIVGALVRRLAGEHGVAVRLDWRSADPQVYRFVSRTLERFTNPNMKKIVDLVGSFDRDGARRLEAFADGSIKDSVDGVVAQRHNIAHGRPSDTTIANVARQFEDAKKLADKLKSLFQ